jgi:hypothetical protein
MKECKKGDYFKYKERIVIVSKDWALDPTRRFNILLVEDIENGNTLRIPRKNTHNIVKLSAAERKQYEIDRSNALSNSLEQDKEIIKQVGESLESIFPGNWDIAIGKIVSNLYTVTIKFPQLTIINGKGSEHNIRDLYVRWRFTKGFKMSKGLAGVRGLISYIEYRCGYIHSHLPSFSYASAETTPTFHTFCLGSGDFADLNRDWHIKDSVFDQRDFELLLYQLDAYVRWESLQGGPYMRMDTIGVGNQNSYLDEHTKKNQFESTIYALDHFPLKFDHLSRRFKVTYSSLENMLMKTDIPELTKIKKTPNGEYLYGDVTFNTIQGWIEKGNEVFSKEPLLTFRGKDVYLKIMEFSGETTNSNLLEVPHPDVTKYILEQLTQKTNNYFIKTYGK